MAGDDQCAQPCTSGRNETSAYNNTNNTNTSIYPTSTCAVQLNNETLATNSVEEDRALSVRVSLRVRPQLTREQLQLCRVCTSVLPDTSQVLLGDKQAFTYDYVFDQTSAQQSVYESCATQLVEQCFHGYNATILAYGQTGSGKTYTMGTAFDLELNESELGIIPRAVAHIFNGIQHRVDTAKAQGLAQPVFETSVEFIELYNDEVIDLLNPHTDTATKTLSALKDGALCRSTASTNMNTESSRSHAIFTLHIKQHRHVKLELEGEGVAGANADWSDDSNEHDNALLPQAHGQGQAGGQNSPDSGLAVSVPDEFELLTAKLHFVDLAGSERMKRTGATGDRAKEAININKGLLALGNVISALGDVSLRVKHVPYRDSKLTRLLQDSLGGNSRTLMIACVSPSDCDFMETLNTLHYANRARNIKNKVCVNRDNTSAAINDLKQQMLRLQTELNEFKQGKRLVSADGTEVFNDQYHENCLLRAEVEQLRVRVRAQQDTNDTLQMQNARLKADTEVARLTGQSEGDMDMDSDDIMTQTVHKYMMEMEHLRTLLCESQSTCENYRRQLARFKQLPDAAQPDPMQQSITTDMGDSTWLDPEQPNQMKALIGTEPIAQSADAHSVLNEAKRELSEMKDKARRLGLDADAEHPQMMTATDTTCMLDSHEEHNQHDVMMMPDDVTQSDDDGDDEETETDDAADTEQERVREELASVQTEITIKERLILELERNEQKLKTMRLHYETRLKELLHRINETEAERDRILHEIASRAQQDTNSKHELQQQVKQEYEQKLGAMRHRVNQMQAAEREHKRMMQQQQQQHSQIDKLRQELGEMKKTKVSLMNRMREESKKALDAERQRNREVTQLEKVIRRREAQIAQLQTKDEHKDNLLKRKQDEVAELKRKHKEQQNMKRMAQSASAASQQRSINASMTSRSATRSTVAVNQSMTSQRTAVANQRSPMTRNVNAGDQSPLTPIAARFVARTSRTNGSVSAPFNTRQAKLRWNQLERKIGQIVAQRQTVSQLGAELDRLIQLRQERSAELNDLNERLTQASSDQSLTHTQQTLTNEERVELSNERSTVHAHLEYINTQIADTQKSIMLIDEQNKVTDTETSEPSCTESCERIVDGCRSVAEAKYLLLHLYHASVEHAVQAAHRHSQAREYEAKLRQQELQSKVHETLLNQVIEASADFSSLLPPTVTNDSAGPDTTDQLLMTGSNESLGVLARKARRRTATTDELLYERTNPNNGAGTGGLGTVPEEHNTTRDHSPNTPNSRGYRAVGVGDSRPMTCTPVNETDNGVPSRPMSFSGSASSQSPRFWLSNPRLSLNEWRQSLRLNLNGSNQSQSGTDLMLDQSASSTAAPMSQSANTNHSSPRLRRQSSYRKTYSGSALNRQSAMTASCRNMAQSSEQPVLGSQSGELGNLNNVKMQSSSGSKSVYARLAEPSSEHTQPNSGVRGYISAFDGKRQPQEQTLHCAHVVYGHKQAVLCVDADQQRILTGSKDRTCRLWDMSTGAEVQSMGPHPNNVHSVKLLPGSQMCYTLCNAQVRLWDLRSQHCVSTLNSSGLCAEGSGFTQNTNRQTTLPSSEYALNAIALLPGSSSSDTAGNQLLTTAGGTKVTQWRYRPGSASYCVNGRLLNATSSPRSEVLCVCVVACTNKQAHWLVTGARDHTIKRYTVHNTLTVPYQLQPDAQLSPPHYDGVTSLLCTNATDGTDQQWLFSAGRDQNIMKWNLDSCERLGIVSKAHKAWILAMNPLPTCNEESSTASHILSACREGFVKVWRSHDCALTDEIRAHGSAINALAQSDGLVFTASSDNTVGLWRVNESRLLQSAGETEITV